MQRDPVTVESFYTRHSDSLQLRLLAGAAGLKRIIREPTVNRPGLALAGFTKYFANKRVQVMGNAECHFLKSLPIEQREGRYRELLSFKIPCLVFCRGYQPDKLFLRIAEEHDVPVFKCPLIT